MTKKCFRFYGGLLSLQERWLNRMANKGFRLTSCSKLFYSFESCSPKQYEYKVEFIGDRCYEEANEYQRFLEEFGYVVFRKSINLNYSVGHIRYRPWAKKGGRISTNATTFNRELFIVEKVTDGKPFELRTSLDDNIRYYGVLRNMWLTTFGALCALGVLSESLIWFAVSFFTALPAVVYQRQLRLCKNIKKTEE